MQVQQQTTVLLSADLAANRRFFVELLGFDVAMDIGWFASLRHPTSSATLDLWARDHSSVPPVAVGPSTGFLLAFVVEDATAAEARFRGAAVPIVEPLKDEPWGQRHFIAASPDGVLLDIVQRIAPAPEWLAANGLA